MSNFLEKSQIPGMFLSYSLIQVKLVEDNGR